MRNELNYEKQESEKLLLNCLPKQAIERLGSGEFPVSDKYRKSKSKEEEGEKRKREYTERRERKKENKERINEYIKIKFQIS